MSACTLSTHVLDLERGLPAANLRVELLSRSTDRRLCSAVTNRDGRITDWSPEPTISAGHWELLFHTGEWFEAQRLESFYPVVSVRFVVSPERSHLHLPLLLNRYGYSTYRGS